MAKFIRDRMVALRDPEAGNRIVRLMPGQRVPSHLEEKISNASIEERDVEDDVQQVDDPSPDETVFKKALEDHTVPELRQIAEDEGVDITGLSKKQELVDAIDEHRAIEGDDEDEDEGEDDNGGADSE